MRLVCVFARARAFSGDRLDDHESWATMCVMCMGRPGNRISRCHFRWRNIVHDHTHIHESVLCKCATMQTPRAPQLRRGALRLHSDSDPMARRCWLDSHQTISLERVRACFTASPPVPPDTAVVFTTFAHSHRQQKTTFIVERNKTHNTQTF